MNTLRTALRGTGQVLITGGLVILLFCVYELWYTGFYTAREQKKERKALEQQWQVDPLGPDFNNVQLGHGLAILRIPALGDNYSKVIVEGVATEDLKKGPGHYPGTALPGKVGNFVVSGHRTTYGAPFNRLDEVKPGDAIVIETKHQWLTYRELREIVVDPNASWVLDPVPGEPDAVPHERLLTFTTCHPKYSATNRLVLFGKLTKSHRKVPGYLPPALSVEG